MPGYNFKLDWKSKNVKVEAGDTFVVDVDTTAVAGALAVADSFVNVGVLMNLSAASLAAYVAVKGARKVWSWIDATKPPTKDLLQLSVPEDKKPEFERLVDGGELEEKMQEALQNPRQSIRNSLDSSVPQSTVDELVKRLEDIDLSSLTKCTGDHGGVQGVAVEGKLKMKTVNRTEIIASTTKSGNVIGTRIGKDAEAKFVHEGGIQMIGGIRPDVQKHAIDAAAGNRVKVSVMFDDLTPTYDRVFGRDKRIHDVIIAIKEKTGKVYQIKHCDTDTLIDRRTTLESLDKSNDLTNLMAYPQT